MKYFSWTKDLISKIKNGKYYNLYINFYQEPFNPGLGVNLNLLEGISNPMLHFHFLFWSFEIVFEVEEISKINQANNFLQRLVNEIESKNN